MLMTFLNVRVINSHRDREILNMDKKLIPVDGSIENKLRRCYGREKSTGTPIFILVILYINPLRMFSKKCANCFREI